MGRGGEDDGERRIEGVGRVEKDIGGYEGGRRCGRRGDGVVYVEGGGVEGRRDGGSWGDEEGCGV